MTDESLRADVIKESSIDKVLIWLECVRKYSNSMDVSGWVADLKTWLELNSERQERLPAPLKELDLRELDALEYRGHLSAARRNWNCALSDKDKHSVVYYINEMKGQLDISKAELKDIGIDNQDTVNKVLWEGHRSFAKKHWETASKVKEVRGGSGLTPEEHLRNWRIDFVHHMKLELEYANKIAPLSLEDIGTSEKEIELLLMQ